MFYLLPVDTKPHQDGTLLHPVFYIFLWTCQTCSSNHRQVYALHPNHFQYCILPLNGKKINLSSRYPLNREQPNPLGIYMYRARGSAPICIVHVSIDPSSYVIILCVPANHPTPNWPNKTRRHDLMKHV